MGILGIDGIIIKPFMRYGRQPLMNKHLVSILANSIRKLSMNHFYHVKYTFCWMDQCFHETFHHYNLPSDMLVDE